MQSYDSIIVGGGSAGCVVARRLSDNTAVLLLKAGYRRVHTRPRRHSGIQSRSSAKRPNVNLTIFFSSNKRRAMPWHLRIVGVVRQRQQYA
jgi:choline dehydrogenase-like flavoprotein